MKRLLAVLFALTLVLIIPVSALADMGMPEEPLFESFVITRGFTVSYTDYSWETPVERTRTLPIGKRLKFYGRYGDLDGNTLWEATVMLEDNYEVWITITDDQMRTTMPSKDVFPVKKAPEPEYEFTGVVDADPCLNIRNGPSTEFNMIGFIPDNTAVTYRYVYDNSWGYATYNGVSGWVSLDFINVTSKKSLKPQTETDKPEDNNNGNNADDNNKSEDVSADNSWDHIPKDDEAFLESVSKMMGNDSGKLVILCIIGAVIVAVTVLVVVVLIVKLSGRERVSPPDNTVPQADIDYTNNI